MKGLLAMSKYTIPSCSMDANGSAHFTLRTHFARPKREPLQLKTRQAFAWKNSTGAMFCAKPGDTITWCSNEKTLKVYPPPYEPKVNCIEMKCGISHLVLSVKHLPFGALVSVLAPDPPRIVQFY